MPWTKVVGLYAALSTLGQLRGPCDLSTMHRFKQNRTAGKASLFKWVTVHEESDSLCCPVNHSTEEILRVYTNWQMCPWRPLQAIGCYRGYWLLERGHGSYSASDVPSAYHRICNVGSFHSHRGQGRPCKANCSQQESKGIFSFIHLPHLPLTTAYL